MALKGKTNQYIKMEVDGTFLVYQTAKERDLEKKAVSYTEIVSKYRKIIANLKQNKERCYYDPEYYQLTLAWEAEYSKYLTSRLNGKKEAEFPLMSQYFPDINNSLPTIIARGRLGVDGNSLKEVYEQIKKYKYFGEVTDC